MKLFPATIRKTILRGCMLILPIIVVCFFIGKMWMAIHLLVRRIMTFFDIERLFGFTLLALLTTVVFILLCYLAGLLTRLETVGVVHRWLDKNVLRFMPGFIFIQMMAQESAGEETSRQGVLIWLDEAWQPAILIEKNADGWHVVYIPNAPNASSGRIYIVKADRLKLLPGSLHHMKESI